ncbi:hypothetical protein LTS08_003593 [Lithohypha guttulata]|nr:hypothetical protein LTS08_003593 [Lithohypha guttulata]
MKGFYRCLLFQFLQQCPQLITQLRGYFSHSSLFSEQIDSDVGNLQQAFFDVLEALVADHNLFLVIDGVDECEQVDGQDELIDVVLQASELPNVKICVSSRPENIFKDAFHHCPQLRVEDLTFTDIHYYITSQLHRSRRWVIIEAEDKSRAFEFTMQIIYMASGVFLWATLAMRDLLQALRDGDSLDQLYAKLKLLPADLDRYFQSILSSIKFEHRREASTLLQLALFNEDKFGSIFTLRLIDTFFVAESDEDFCLGPSFEPYCRDLADEAVLRSRTDSSLRKLSSRCKGLLEPVHWKQIQDSDDMTFAERIELVHNTKLVFLHRSLRDFLLQPQNLSLLYSYTNDRAIDARQYLISARLVQLLAFTSIGLSDDLAVGLASHLLGALSVNAVSSKTSAIASVAKPAIEWLAQAADVTGPDYSYWYINGSLEEWYHEHSDFLTLAIDFQLSSYVLDNMTSY